MFRVKNSKLVKRLTIQNIRAHKVRNRVAVLAIVLTTILFTGMFSILASLNASFEQETFRQMGGDFHAGLKDISEDQAKEFAADPMVKQAGMRYLLGMAGEVPFNKCQVEVSYMDQVMAADTFCVPEKGALPKEGTKELATDTRVLQLLGITPEIGAEIPFTYTLGNGTNVTDTFTLCGWWEYDSAAIVSMVLVPRSYCDQVLEGYIASEYDSTGKWQLDFMFDNSFNIAGKLDQLLEAHGYQTEDPKEDHYMATGVNWAYTSTQLLQNIEPETIVSVVIFLLLVMFVGYLIIYNIFRISVAEDIQFYGLLKTIGTTEKQIRKIIRVQANHLCLIGIPVGMVLGFLLGNLFVPLIMAQMVYTRSTISYHPVLFAASALFSFVTVRISCKKPAKIAAKVSPVEAVSYSEAAVKIRNHRGSTGSGHRKFFSLRLAFANLGRTKSKTVLVVLSLVLSAVLFNLTFAFSNGFDMDKYTSYFRAADYLVANADYFRSHLMVVNEETRVSDEVVTEVSAKQGIEEMGKIYGMPYMPSSWFTEQALEEYYGQYSAEAWEMQKEYLRVENGLYEDMIELYGMEAFPLKYLTVLDGDMEKVNDPSGNYIIQVIEADDYGNPIEETGAYQVGDTMTITYGLDSIEYDSRTGKELEIDDYTYDRVPEEYIETKPGETWDVTYTVCARAVVPNSISYRFYSHMQFVLGAETFIRDTRTDNTMLYMMNVKDDRENEMDAFLEEYTTKTNPIYDYESKQQYQNEFESFRSMFTIIGSALAFIVGLVGVLNFFNAILTGIQTRKREFAVMQAVGMTGIQLKKTLIFEGVIYTGLAIISAIALNVLCEPFLFGAFENLFWFFTGKMTILPLLLLIPVYVIIGVLVPVVLYRSIEKSSVVERLRVVE